MRSRIASIVGTAVLALGVSTASAFPLYSGIGDTTAGTQFEDNDYDYFLDGNDNGIIDVGDVLVAAVEFSNVLDKTFPFAPVYGLNEAADELVALSVIQVIAPLATDPLNRIRFGQLADIPMVTFYTGGAINLDVLAGDPTVTEAIAAIEDGSFLWAFSITDDPDTEWFFDADIAMAFASDPSVVAGQPSDLKVGAANYALNQVDGPDIFSPFNLSVAFGRLGDGKVDLTGSGDILGGEQLGFDRLGDVNYAFARSDIDVSVNPVPEPATMSLMGLGLLGLAFAGRRSRKSK